MKHIHLFKRPLFPAAVFVALLALLFVHVFPEVIYPESALKDGDKVTIHGRVIKIEEKAYSDYVYIRSGRRTYLLTISDNTSFNLGNTITAEAVYKPFGKARNKGNFDEEDYYRSLGVYQKYKVSSYSVSKDSIDFIPEMLRRLKTVLKSNIENAAYETDSAESSVITAMITGDRSGIDSDTRDLYQSGGISHILAISGLHISFAGMGLFRLLRKKFGVSISAILAISAAGAYCIMSGASPSSVRALIMVSARLVSIRLGKRYDMLSALCLAAVLLLADNPFYITNSGFQLSFAAIVGICAVGYSINDRDSTTATGQKIKNGIISSLAVTLATLPFILNSYYEFPLYGFLLNIAVIPLTSYVLAGSLAGAFAGIISTPISRMILGAVIYTLKLFAGLCGLTSHLPGAMICTGKPQTAAVIIYYVLFAILIIIMRNVNVQQNLISKSNVCSLIIIFLMFAAIMYHPKAEGLQITFLDVDQGECILIVSPEGKTCMIDAGSTGVDEVYRYRIRSALKYMRITKLDYVIITHPDTDHISGVFEMLGQKNAPKIGTILTPDAEGNENYMILCEQAASEHINIRSLHTGIQIKDKSLDLICLHPDAKDAGSDTYAGSDINDRSAVMLLKYNEFQALFTGDISSDVEKELISAERIKSITTEKYFDSASSPSKDTHISLLDVAHHGSKYSSSEQFIDAISPRISVISAGVDNLYGHPSPETVNRLESAGSHIYCTAWHGEIDITVSPAGTITLATMLK